MAIIYTERLDLDSHINKDNYIQSNQCTEKKIEYTYSLDVCNEFSYKSTSVDLDIKTGCKEQFIDVKIEKVDYLRISGELKNTEGESIPATTVTLLKAILVNYKTEYISVCDILTDNNGFFEVILEDNYGDNFYKVCIK
ncbi:MAG: hypothetical protein ACRC68_12375 [Clostridium sp.]